MADGLDILFEDLPRATPSPTDAAADPIDDLFGDLPSQQPGIYRNGEREPPFRAGMYENGRLVKPSGPQPYTGPVPDLALDDAPLRTGGAGVDRLIGSQTGMLTGEQAYEAKQRAEADAAAEVSRMSRIGADMRAAPVESFTPAPSPLFEFERQRAEAEARRTGQPVQRQAMEPTPEQIAETQALEAQAAQEREIARAGAGFDAAQKQQRAVITGQPQSQNPVRSAGESLAASIVAVPAGAADALAIVGEKIAQTTESAEAIRDLNQSVQQYFNGLARPDAAQADDFVAGKVPAGIGSTIGFAVTGLVGKALGLSQTATTALAGALPQAAQEYRNAEAKKASEIEKWIAFVGGLGLGASEALPIANAMERWAQQVPGFRRAFRDTTVAMAEEATQEFGQQMGSNALAKATYDPSRPLTEGVAEGAAVGAITGGALGGAGSFANAAMMRGQAGEGPAGNIDVPVPTMPPLPPELQGAVPEGAVNAEVLLGPDPSMPAPDAAPPAPPQSDPRFALQDILNDPRSADEIRAEMQQDGRLPEPPPPPPPAPPAGDRADPVRIATPEDVTVAAERTATPTPAQAEAGNYAKRHVKWNGLDITIETEAGQQRTGTAEDGQTWAVTLPAPYGYIKRTTGADGDHLDVYVGPNPQGRIFVVDQIDPETRRFDEHKVMLGFDSQEQAQAYYEAGFSDGRGAQRAGAISEIPADQFKQWSQRSNLRRPLRYEPPISAGLTGEQFNQLRQIIKDGGTPLRPDALATTLGARAADVRSVLQRLASRNEIRMAGDGAFSRIPQRTYPLELLQFLAQRGGLQSKQAREVQDLDKVFLPGFGKIARPTGRTLDEAREAAVEAGYLPEGATVRDLLDAVEWSTRGRKRFAAGDQARVIELDGRRAETDAANETLAALERKFADAVAELGVDPAYAELIEADDLTLDGMSPADALATAIERMAVRSLDYAHDAGWMSDQDWQDFDAAFGIRYREPTAQQDDGGLNAVFDDIENSRPQGDGASAPQGREREGADRGRKAGSPQAGEQPREAGGAPGRLTAAEIRDNILETFAQTVDRQAEDSDEVVTISVSADGPWDFNDTYPMPDIGQAVRLRQEGRDFPETAWQVAATFDESLNDMLIDTLDMRRLRAEIADIQLRGVKATKGKTPKIEIERRQQAIQQAEQRIEDTKATYADLWPEAAVTAMMEELARRVAVQTGQQDRGVDRPSSVAREPAPTVEPGAEGKPQTVIPGAERIGQKEQAERVADKPLRAAKPQREAGGMFDQANTAPQLFDAPPATRAENAQVAPKKGGEQIGVNAYGQAVFEDERGVRSYVADGIRMTESVGVRPGGGASVNTSNRSAAFLTAEEQEERALQDTAGTLDERIERYKAEDKTWAEVQNLLDTKSMPTDELLRVAKLWNRGQPTPTISVGGEIAKAKREKLKNATAPEQVSDGVDDRELGEIVREFNDAQRSMVEDGERITHIFDPPAKGEIVRLETKAKATGMLSRAEAKARIAEWKREAQRQGEDETIRSENSQKVVLSLFDYTGEWSKPWEEAGYQVFRFDIQNDPEMGDVNNFSTDFFGDWFGDFDGMDIHAILAACPCTDFASSGARHFAAKDEDGRTVASVKLVQQTLATIEYFKPSIWAVENPVGRIEKLGGLPPWRLSFNPNHLGDPYTKKTLIWGRFNADLPVAPVEATEGSKMWSQYGGKSQRTKNARSATPEGFSYGFFIANNAHQHPAMALANKFDRLDRRLIETAINAGVTPDAITNAVEDFYYMDLDDAAANKAIKDLLPGPPSKAAKAVADSRETAAGRLPVEDARETQRRENVAKAEAAGMPLTAGGKGATNTVFTADAAAAARARLKAKLSGQQLNSGIDPETLKDGITLAGFHIEAGARSFAAYSKAMIEDLGEGIRPYLRSLYESVRYYPGFDAKGMSTAAEIEAGETAPASTETAETTTDTGDLETRWRAAIARFDTANAAAKAEAKRKAGPSANDDESWFDDAHYKYLSQDGRDALREAYRLRQQMDDATFQANYERAVAMLPDGYTAVRRKDPADYGGKVWQDLRGGPDYHRKIDVLNKDGGVVGTLDGILFNPSDKTGWFAEWLKDGGKDSRTAVKKALDTATGNKTGDVTDINRERARRDLQEIADELDQPAGPAGGGTVTSLKPRSDREIIAEQEPDRPLTRLETARFDPNLGKRLPTFQIAEAMRSELLNGASFKTIREARSLAEKATGGRITPSTETAKLIDEAVELGVVLAARDIVAEGKSPGETFDRLVDLYSRQPSLNVRTSTSMIEQAYSTPVPLAYVASRLAGITADSKVYEPSAGNGALLIEAAPTLDSLANELNADRRAALEYQGFLTMDRDASDPMIFEDAVQRRAKGGKSGMDVVIANPPFGVVKDEDGSSRSFRVDDRYTTNEIDHAISIRSLDAMKDDGRAVLIIGGPNKMATTQAARSNAYNGKAKREFYLTLYGEYNVVDHFTVSGDLYAKQGAGWPVDVIVIDGRGKSARKVPAAQVPGVVNSWDELRRKLDVTEATGSTERQAGEPVQRPEAGGARVGLDNDRRGVDAGRPDRAGISDVAPAAGAVGQPVSPDRSGERPAGRPAQLESQQRDGAGDARQDGAGVQRRPTVAQQAQPSLFDTDSSAETAPATTSAPQPKPRQAPAPAMPAAADMTKPQVPYRPRSNANPMGTLVPVNMQTTSQDALTALEKRVGNIDEFVARELGYASVDEMAGYFGAEQVDGIALGIDNFARGAGVIIGDQTGIGKGRQVAGILRWALRQGKVPIFVTEKPNLYADMYRDLTDIGVGEMLGRDLSIFMTNSGERVPLDEEGKKLLTSPQAGPHSAAMSKMIEAGKLDGYDMIFTTYSQMQTVKGEETIRQKFLRVMAANNSVMALDEAHNAGGQAAGAIVVKKDGKEPLTRAKFARELVGLTSAALYSSATYAKRPDVMDLYFKTDMALAVDDISKLGDLIQRGGIPMQQIVAAMLSKAGQYVRRERSFEGITYDTPIVEVDTAKYEEFSRNIALIQQFSENFVSEAVKRIDQDLKEEGRSIATDGATGGAGASSTNFTAVMHNIINQLLLSMKAQDAADRAIAALKRGEKPVITLANTNEAFIDEYAEGVGAQVGDAIGIRFNDVLQRYLDRSRTVTIRKPFAKAGDTERLYLTDKQIGALGVRAYEEAKASIAAADFSLLPVSPIDWIRSQIRAAGYSVSEITGRGLTLDYQITKTGAAEMVEPRAILKMRPGSEKSIAGRRQAIAGFNSGKIDVLILNQSGSTGLSLHASERVLNKNRRRMILAQAEGNIDTHMQMLGRVNRTGQVVKPSYDQLVAGVPAEKRPASILAKKMASLNANTTGARDSAVTAKDTPDFMNVYGDMVARMVMIENPDLNARLGDPVNPEAEDNEGAMRKVTGRIPLLPLKEQEQLYDLLEAEYTALIQQMEASGQNALEAKTLELDARTIGTMQVKDGKNADSPFADAVYFEQVDAKRLGKPMAPAEVVAAIAKAMEVSEPDGTPQQKLTVLAKLGAGEMKERGADALRQFTAFREAERQRIKKDDAKAQNDVKLNGIKERWMALAGKLHPGAGIKLKTDEGNFYGIVVATNFSGRAKNPLALSAWRVNVALADPARSFTVPFSQLYTASTRPEKPAAFDIEIESTDSVGSMPLLDAFADMQAERREERIIVTGNILAGYDFVNGQGQIVNFTDSEGRLRQGILMRRGFDAEKFIAKKAVQLRSGRQIQTYLDRVQKSLVTSTDKHVMIRRNLQNGDTLFLIDAARQNGGKYFLNRAVLDAAGRDFVKVSDRMRLEVPPTRAPQVADAIIKAGAVFEVSDNIDIAREIAGKVEFSPAPRGWDVAEPMPKRAFTEKDKIELAQIVGRVAGVDLSIGFPDEIQIPAGTPAARGWGKEAEAFEAGGYYDWANDVIAVSQNIGGPITAYHEAFHRLQTRALTKAQLEVLAAETERLKDIIRRSPLGRNVEQMSQREIEADAFSLFAMARDRKEVPAGFPARVRMIFEKLYKILRAAVNWMKGRGFQTYEDIFTKAWRGDLADAADNNTGGVGGPLLSLSAPAGAQDTTESRKSLIMQAIGKGQPLDRIMRMPFDIFGGLDSDGRWQPGVKLDAEAKRIIVDAKLDPNGRFGWLAGPIENARAGLIDRYGLDEDYQKRERGRANDERAVLARGAEILTDLMERTLTAEESRVLQAMLTGEAVSEGDMGKLAEPIREAIDQLGQEAVSLGLISAESYERNRGTYLHRVYTKDLQDANGLTRWVDRMMTSRRKKIIGDQLKGRGIFLEMTQDRLLRDDPEFAAAKRGRAAKGERFMLIQQVQQQQNVEGGTDEKVVKRVWWPADRPLPARYEGFSDGGVWEVRAVTPSGGVTLWRDYTKAERTKMGEILDARYTIGKTYSLMAHDLANGRFFKDIAENEDWSQAQVPDQPWREASEYGRFWNDPSIEWVKVPNTDIPDTGGKKRWGALAGRYVRAEIWRDLNETAIAQNPSVWRRLLGIWKLNKTARSPVTHMNNIMSNLMFMDLADIRAQDLVRGIQSFIKKDEAFRLARDNGAFGNDMMAVEFKAEILQPLLDEITKQQTTNGASNPWFAKAAAAGKMADLIWEGAKKLDQKMIDAYRIEDEIFRMATFMRRREMGDSPQEAADFARRQFLDYDIKAPWVVAARNTVLPFISYVYRAVPLIAEAIAHRPWKLAKYYAVAYAANALAYAADDGGDEERERASMRKDEQGWLWIGVPRMVRMPWRDANGLPVFLDARRWVPAGDIFDAGQGSSALPLPAPFMPGGPIMLGAEFALNKVGFTGKGITNERTDTWWDSTYKTGDWAWKSLMPNAPWVPGSWSGERIAKAWRGGADAGGNPLSMKEAVSSSFGVKVAGRDVDQGFAMKFYEQRRIERELRDEARLLARQRSRNLISQEVFERELANIVKKRQKVAEDTKKIAEQNRTKQQRETKP